MSEETSKIVEYINSKGAAGATHDLHTSVYKLCKNSSLVTSSNYGYIREEIHIYLWNIINREIFYAITTKAASCLSSETQ